MPDDHGAGRISVRLGNSTWAVTYLRIVFPEPAINPGAVSDYKDYNNGIFTFSMNPQQGARCHPVGKDLPFDAPRCSTLVLSVGCSVEISRWVRGIDPLSEVLARLVPYRRGQSFVVEVKLGHYERFRSLTCLNTTCIPSLASSTPNRVRLSTHPGVSKEKCMSPVFIRLT